MCVLQERRLLAETAQQELGPDSLGPDTNVATLVQRILKCGVLTRKTVEYRWVQGDRASPSSVHCPCYASVVASMRAMNVCLQRLVYSMLLLRHIGSRSAAREVATAVAWHCARSSPGHSPGLVQGTFHPALWSALMCLPLLPHAMLSSIMHSLTLRSSAGLCCAGNVPRVLYLLTTTAAPSPQLVLSGAAATAKTSL